MPNKDRYRIEILDLALDVIEHLHSAKGEFVGPREVGRSLGINHSRAYRILKTLEQRGYLEFDPQSQNFRLGLKFLEIGQGVREQVDLLAVVRPVLMELAHETGESAHLVVLHGQRAVIVDRYRGHYRLQVTAPLGEPLHLHVGASPKLLLAYMPEDERNRILQEMELPSFTSKTITDRDELRRSLDEIRSLGYAVDEGDLESGVYAIGAPVFDVQGRVVAGLTVTIPHTRFNADRKQELIDIVVESAMRISTQLGYTKE